MDEPHVDVTDNRERTRYEAHLDGELAGVLVYDEGDGSRRLLHTVVGEEFAGHGVGSALARFAIADARESGWRIVPVCTFVQGWLKRRPEHADLVVGSAG